MDKMQQELKQLYEDWSDELILKSSALLDKDYSNPYYTSIPENWNNSKDKIMIIGEEGWGKWGCGKAYGEKETDPSWTIKDINLIQEYNKKGVENYPNKNTAFWRRFRKIKELGYPCIWNNLDKIHSLKYRKGLKYQLTRAEEQLLHMTDIKVLQSEIKILKPTVVVFFGWHYDSLSIELPEISKNLYHDDSLWKYTVYSIKEEGITYIFTYHPGWRGKNKPKNYEEMVLKEIKKVLNG